MKRPDPCEDSTACPACHGLGQDNQAHFWCSPCEGRGWLPARLWHYEVTSPDMTEYHGGMEPPETFACWGLYLVSSARAALVAAVKDPEFRPWVDEARSDGVIPFKGMRAELAVCEHGVCWSCDTDEDEVPTCPPCRVAFDSSDALA